MTRDLTIFRATFAAPRRGRPQRRAVAMVETALILIVLILLIFGMFDLGLAVFRYTVVSQGARQGGRQAIVHGSMATKTGIWGPDTYEGAAAADHPISNAVRPYVESLDLEQTIIKVEWPDGNNRPESRVRVTVSTTYQPFLTFVFGNPTWTLRAISTVQIAH